MRKIAILALFAADLSAQVLVGTYVRHVPYGAAAGQTGRAVFYELAANGENFFSLQAADAMTADTPYTWPAAYPPGAGYALVSGATGTMSWTLLGGGVAVSCTTANAICFGDGATAVGDVAFLSWNDAAKQMIVGGPTPNETLTVEGDDNLVSFPFGLYNANVSAFTGVGQRFRLKSSTGVIRNAATWQVQWADNTNAAEKSIFSLINMNAGAFSTNFQISGVDAMIPSGGLTIGSTAAPAQKLHVIGRARVDQDANALQLVGTTTAYQEFYPAGIATRYGYQGFASGNDYYLINERATGALFLGANGASKFTIVPAGVSIVGNSTTVPAGATLALYLQAGADASADPAAGSIQWSTNGEWKYRSQTASEGSGGIRRVHNRGEQVAAAGTGYTFTTSLAFMAFGTTNPEIVLPTTGVYRIEGRLTIHKNGATTTNQTLFLVLRNANTGTNIENGVLLDLGNYTTISETFETVTWSTIYTQNTAGETIKIAGNLSAAIGAGSIIATEGYIQYVRLS